LEFWRVKKSHGSEKINFLICVQFAAGLLGMALNTSKPVIEVFKIGPIDRVSIKWPLVDKGSMNTKDHKLLHFTENMLLDSVVNFLIKD
jgi:hypothetical protein